MIDPLIITLILMNLILFVANVVLFIANNQLKNDLYQREKWHDRELRKWRTRL